MTDTPVPDVRQLAARAVFERQWSFAGHADWSTVSVGGRTNYLAIADAVLAAVTPVIRQERDEARAALSIVEENFRELERQRDHLVLAVKARDIAVREADRLRAAAETALENVRHLHQQYRGVPDFDICAGCSIGMEVRAVPCPTVAAVDTYETQTGGTE